MVGGTYIPGTTVGISPGTTVGISPGTMVGVISPGTMVGIISPGTMVGIDLPVCVTGTMVGIDLPVYVPGIPWWVYTPRYMGRYPTPGTPLLPPTTAGVPSSARPALPLVCEEALGSDPKNPLGERG